MRLVEHVAEIGEGEVTVGLERGIRVRIEGTHSHPDGEGHAGDAATDLPRADEPDGAGVRARQMARREGSRRRRAPRQT